MAATKEKHPKLARDVLIVAAGAAFVLMIGAAGTQAGHPIVKGPAAIIGGFYTIYLGMLFLLSYFFPDATYVRCFLLYICEECTRGLQGRHMAFGLFALA